jgi:hypothetical protein
MYMNLAISLVTDLGLDRENPNPSRFSDFDLRGLYTKEGDYTLAAKRAYLGTYYLSSAYDFLPTACRCLLIKYIDFRWASKNRITSNIET